MTVDREKLREELAQALYAYDENARNRLSPMPWASETEARRRPYRARAEIAIAGPLAPILAQADSAERVAAERDEARARSMPHMCRDGHPEIRHADSGEDERCPVCRERDRAGAAEDRVTHLSAEVERLRFSLAPFAAVADRTEARHGDQIPDHWSAVLSFGLCREARTALSTPGTDAPAAAQEGSDA